MLPDDRHGTLVGYSRGCRCEDCTRARRIHETKRRMDADKGIRYTVPALGTHRRIRALMAIGWTSSHISQEAGFDSANAVTLIFQRERINRRTVEKIDRAYRALCMKPGPSVISRKRAATRGWAPPLAWDDIDRDKAPKFDSGRDDITSKDATVKKGYVDHAVVWRVLQGEVLPTTTAERQEIMRRWLAAGHSEKALCDRMGWRDGRYSLGTVRGPRNNFQDEREAS